MSDLHVHEFQETVVAPTCKEPGYTLYQCACGYGYKGNYKPVGNHNFKVAESQPATCTESGKILFVCETCGEQAEKVVPATGHQFGAWSVQNYPACTEPGKQVRKCVRCDALEEMELAPMGHKCAPGTERREGGRVVEFFCENCGKTIHCQTERKPVVQGILPQKQCVITKTLAVITMILAAANILCLAVATLTEDLKLGDGWLYYLIPGVLLVASLVFFFTADTVKPREHYTRWMGILPLLAVVCYVFSTAPYVDQWNDYMKNFDHYGYYAIRILDYILQFSVLIGIQLVLAILMFAGKKKQGWAFALIVYGAFFQFVMGMGIFYQDLLYAKYDRVEHATLLWRATLFASMVLSWVNLAMLVCPVKKTER